MTDKDWRTATEEISQRAERIERRKCLKITATSFFAFAVFDADGKEHEEAWNWTNPNEQSTPQFIGTGGPGGFTPPSLAEQRRRVRLRELSKGAEDAFFRILAATRAGIFRFPG